MKALLLLNRMVKCTFYLGSSWRFSAKEYKILDEIGFGLTEEHREVLENQLLNVECVRSMIGGKFKVVYINHSFARRFCNDLSKGRLCLGVVELSEEGRKSKVGVIVDDGWLYSLEFKSPPPKDYLVLGLAKNQKWSDGEAALERLEHGGT